MLSKIKEVIRFLTLNHIYYVYNVYKFKLEIIIKWKQFKKNIKKMKFLEKVSNDILFQVVKYTENSCSFPRVHCAQISKENIIRKNNQSKKKLQSLLQDRKEIEDLKRRNILKDSDNEINFKEIHSKLEKIINKNMSHRINKVGLFNYQVSVNIFEIGKSLDFGLKRKILKKLLSKRFKSN